MLSFKNVKTSKFLDLLAPLASYLYKSVSTQLPKPQLFLFVVIFFCSLERLCSFVYRPHVFEKNYNILHMAELVKYYCLFSMQIIFTAKSCYFIDKLITADWVHNIHQWSSKLIFKAYVKS